MNFSKIAIIGLGLIGGSLALAIKQTGFTGHITGIGRREENLIKAREFGMIDNYTTVHEEGVHDADLVVLASCTGHFTDIMNSIKTGLKTGSIVTDVGSVKARIVQTLDDMMPQGVSFVGAHPIAGKECSGIDCASADLFRDSKCIITPSAKTVDHAIDNVIELWESVGSVVLHMNPEEHDRIFAAVSHMPHVVAYAVVNTIMDVNPNILHFGGTGLKDMTRIALSPAELWRDICSSNKDEVLNVLKKFSSHITALIAMFENSDWPGLEQEFIKAQEARKLIESD
ncbi:MAG: prephenate dehydrogenase/arogenate dehydrogenase family protein [Nitrospiraceae bacterium]|nr:MAG: prephenate dehydrogenase/arogenate dehydrogenase family protein [Nitrospiraceae bacterium]